MNVWFLTRSTAWLTVVVMLVAVIVAGCGPSPAPATPAPAATVPAAGAPKDGGILKVAFITNPADLAPGKNAQLAPALIFEHIYDTLLRQDKNGNLVPGLALSYEVLPDNKTYIFKLRQGVKWHHGREFDAEDVKYTFDRLADPATASPWVNILKPALAHSPEVVDKYTVKFTFDQPFAPFLTYCATAWYTAIVPRDFVPTHNLNKEASGTGPFMLKEYVPDNYVTLVKNPNYWDKGLPHLDGVEFKIMPDVQSQIAALRTGFVDIAAIGDPKLLSTVEGIQGTYMVPAADAVTVPGLALNSAEGPTADVRVRRALSMGMDRKALIAAVLFGKGQITTRISCGIKPYGYCGDGSDLPYYKYDPEGAKKLLAEAGYAKGLDLTMKVAKDMVLTVQTAELLKEQWAKIGVNLQIQVIADHNKFVDDFIKVNHQTAMIQHPWQPDPDFTYQIYHSTSTINLGKFKDAKLDTLLEQSRTEVRIPERVKLYRQIQELVADQAYLLYPWSSPANWQSARSYVKGYDVMPSGSFTFLRNVWLDK